jgi:hypothetical protein
MKTGESRITDSINYIYGIGKSELANHLSITVRTGNPSQIGKELSLGSRPDGEDDPQYAANTKKTARIAGALALPARLLLGSLVRGNPGGRCPASDKSPDPVSALEGGESRALVTEERTGD